MVTEINKLEAGQEMDELVAIEIMGWHKRDYRYGRDGWLDDKNRFQCGISNYDGYEDEEDFHILKWHPSESIMWAWNVMDKLDVIWVTKTFGMSGVKWIAKIDKIEVFEETAPLAICKCALLYKIG